MLGVFEASQVFLQRGPGRVAGARVLETLVLAYPLLRERGRQMDRLDDGTGGRVRALSDV